MLYIVATPIGNLEDITLRALRVFKESDLILAEDTRKTAMLLKHFGINKKLESFYDHNEKRKIPFIIEQLKIDKTITLVSSAGTPTVSDPGYKLVRACRGQQIPVTSVPGACSIINGIALSSLPHDKFIFVGYLPRKTGEKKRLLEKIRELAAAIVFLESPFRIVKSLKEIQQILGNRKVTVAREMTKKFEEVFEGDSSAVVEHFEKKKIKGEFTVVVGSECGEGQGR
ncbi:MAG: 16S rRNA (cytidine(1402)-2'-O)-methyltransferase [Candidatus Omnitrophota bacterium]|nr:16S rRNA (cytidine(1402)-2'-O)-methyltransferase [Candidatus Omnitrophota bacterium]